ADLVSAAELQSLRETIGARTRVISTVQAQIPDALLLGERTPRNGFTPVPTPHHELFESWTWQATQALPAKALRDWLGQLPKDLFR
ncbi:hypothetical protein, partial [Salmonella enterica]|uniref:hypothetical protein n=1 Tax=Salmonella enterica TaxID=28901 RepID=UPI0022B6A01D